MLPELAVTTPQGLHEASTRLDGSTGILDGPIGPDTGVRTAPPSRRSVVGDWGRFLLGLGVAFVVSAAGLFVLKSRRAHEAAEHASRIAAVPVVAPAAVAPVAVAPVAVVTPLVPVSPEASTLAPMRPAAAALKHVRHRAAADDAGLGSIVMSTGNADVTVDGTYAGHTPLRYTISPGRHRVTLFDIETSARRSVEVQVTAGHASKVGFDTP